MRTVLSLDLSTTCTGWAFFNADESKLLSWGTLKPSSKYNGEPIGKFKYPKQQLCKMIDLAFKIRTLIENQKPDFIVIEEIAGSKQRLGQKVLDGLHWIVLYHIQEYIPIITYYDVSGSNGWRTHLGLKLSDADKLANKEAKKLNPKLARGTPKLPEYNAKDLACRHANKQYQLNLDPQVNQHDNDVGDAVCIGDAFIRFRIPKSI